MSDPRPGYLLPHRATVLAIACSLLCVLLAALNQTIVATALPRIADELGGLAHYSWVFSAYMLGATVTAPISGRLSDAYGRGPFFVTGILLFMAGSLVGGTADSMTQVIVARAIQGLGTGALIPLAMAVIGDLVPPSDRGRWQGLVGAVMGAASVLGPFSGGWITDHADWRWVFFLSLPVACVALVMVPSTLRIPPHPDRATSIDYAGAVLFASGLSCVMLGTVRLGEPAPRDPVEISLLFGVGAVLLGVLGWHERRASNPIVPLSLFRLRTFSAAAATSFTVGIGMFGAIMCVPLFMQGVLGESATSAGLVLAPLMLAMMAASAGSGQLIARTGRYRWAIVSGPVLMGCGFALLAALDTQSSQGDATLAMIMLGLGLGLLVQNLMLVIQNTVPSRELGTATSAGQFFRTTGATIGVTATGALMTAGLPASVSLVGAEQLAAGTGAASREQLANAIHPVFVVGLPLMVVALALVLLIPEQPLRRTVRETEPPPVPA